MSGERMKQLQERHAEKLLSPEEADELLDLLEVEFQEFRRKEQQAELDRYNPPNFRCPLCNADRCVAIFEERGILGQKAPIKEYQCAGCSVRFGDPECFTQALKNAREF